jgi:hypothetical protein
MIFPQFVIGGGWASVLTLTEVTGQATTGRIDIFDSSGQPLPLNLNANTQSTFRYAIPPGGVFVLAPRNSSGQSPF